MTTEPNPSPDPNFNEEFSSEEEPLLITDEMLADHPERGRADFESGMSSFPPLTLILIALDLLGNKSKAQREFYSFHPFLSRI